jgi:hypothetical protein
MFSFSRANHITTCNGRVYDSNIDMNGKIITSHSLPVNPTDVATKQYVDAFISQTNPPIIVTLTSTSYTVISTELLGNFVISVNSVVPGGPAASFKLSKNSPLAFPSFVRDSSNKGIGTNETLDMLWDPGTGMSLKKTGNGYDGTYSVKIIKN